ncbi:MAG: hypothetical protein U1E15_00110 [Hyphomicrobiales bacterium]
MTPAFSFWRGGVARSASTVTLHDPALYVAPKPGQTPRETVSAYLKMLMPKDAISRVADVPQGARCD